MAKIGQTHNDKIAVINAQLADKKTHENEVLVRQLNSDRDKSITKANKFYDSLA